MTHIRRSLLRASLVTIAVLATWAIVAVGCCTFSAPRYRGPRSGHFDGDRFHNLSGPEPKGLGDVLRWKLTSFDRPAWRPWTHAAPGERPPARVEAEQLRVTFVNHATVLIQTSELNILTDPIWSERASPVSWAGPKRVRPPGIAFDDLPEIDVVLISHNHYDHLDLPTLERLAKRHAPEIFVPLGNGALLERAGIARTRELDWWQAVRLSEDVRISFVPAQHFSARGACDRDATLWGGFVLEAHGGPVYFAGDTAMGPHFQQIRARFGAIRLAILPIGAFEPRWFMAPVHISPEEALAAHHLLGASTSVGMHYGTFHLADEGEEEAPERLRTAIDRAPAPRPRFWVLGFGEGRDVPVLGDGR